ncbi:MAG: anthranilate phosphoribosyltransferase, partial [Chloroflexi bacterium]|nr:anthranilate phosphoribosyltransferase [Chloroflexota bacterium]
MAGPNSALLVEGRVTREIVIDGADFGLKRAAASALRGGDAQLNSA